MRRRYRGLWFLFYFLTGPKFNVNTSGGSPVIKKALKDGVYTLSTLKGLIVLKMHDLYIVSYLSSHSLCFIILEETLNPLMPGGNKKLYILRQFKNI